MGEKEGKFDINTDPSDHDNPGVEYCIRFYLAENKKVCIEFRKVSGDLMEFSKAFKEFKTNYLKDIVSH